MRLHQLKYYEIGFGYLSMAVNDVHLSLFYYGGTLTTKQQKKHASRKLYEVK